jgi:hypothetical protein
MSEEEENRRDEDELRIDDPHFSETCILCRLETEREIRREEELQLVHAGDSC